jgi:HEAT repeat protein
MTHPAGLLAVAALVAAGGLAGASPTICAFPPYGGRTFGSAAAQTPPTREDIDRTIDRLGAFADEQRIDAARALRRAAGTIVLPALVDAASSHADGHVRYRALVLLAGYDDPRVADQMEIALSDASDRLRAVGYGYFERFPDKRLLPALLKALDKESGEFARPALVRAVAAQATDGRARAALLKDLARGPEFFRGATIEALGDFRATFAVKPLTDIAVTGGDLSGPAALTLGMIGDRSSQAVLAGLQGSATREAAPRVATAGCLLTGECAEARAELVRTLTSSEQSPGFQNVARAAAAGLAALAVAGDVEAGRSLFDIGITGNAVVRARVVHGLAVFAVKRPDAAIKIAAERPDRAASIDLLRDGFDRLDDGLAKELFFVAIRKLYFDEPEVSPKRPLIQLAINTLEY